MAVYGKRGSAFVEAAMVLPLVIFAVLCVVWMLISMYTQVSLRSGVHMALRRSAGIASDTILLNRGEGYQGIYDTLLKAREISELTEQQAEKVFSGGGTGEGVSFKGAYHAAVPVSSIQLEFSRAYRNRMLFHRDRRADNTCWYYMIDEAQWVRNQEWIRELGEEMRTST